MGKFNFNQENFKKVRDEAERLYQTLNSVYCPYLKEKVLFNAKGLRHLKFKSDQQARAQKDQYPRLKLLYLAPQVLSKSHTLQGIWRTRRFEHHKTSGTWKYIMKNVIFYEFIAVLDNVRIKVKEYYMPVIRILTKLKNTASRYSLVALGYSLDSRDRAKALQEPLSL